MPTNQIDQGRGTAFPGTVSGSWQSLFVGVTGVFDHRASAEGQHARIFAARVVEDPSRPTNCGEPYTALRAEIYMPRNEKTAGLIAEIDAGIKKEVSVSCAVSRSVCSVWRRTRRHLLPPAGQTLWGDPLPCDPLRRHRRL